MRPFLLISLVAAALAAAVFVAAPTDDAAVRGLWSRHPYGSGGDADPVSFYYFHEGDIGLYRYGKVAYNNTHSYHYDVSGDTLTLRMNKTGVAHALRYRVERGEGPPVLVVTNDPHNPGVAETRYTWVPPSTTAPGADDLFFADQTRASSDAESRALGIDNRLWMDLKTFTTGGMGFSLYQLRPAGIDGRGTGWHHVGDFDDWSTESLAYRVVNVDDGHGLALTFPLRGDRTVSPLVVAGEGKSRTLTLRSDPREFWAAHSFVDAGPSFGSFRAVALSR